MIRYFKQVFIESFYFNQDFIINLNIDFIIFGLVIIVPHHEKIRKIDELNLLLIVFDFHFVGYYFLFLR